MSPPEFERSYSLSRRVLAGGFKPTVICVMLRPLVPVGRDALIRISKIIIHNGNITFLRPRGSGASAYDAELHVTSEERLEHFKDLGGTAMLSKCEADGNFGPGQVDIDFFQVGGKICDMAVAVA